MHYAYFCSVLRRTKAVFELFLAPCSGGWVNTRERERERGDARKSWTGEQITGLHWYTPLLMTAQAGTSTRILMECLYLRHKRQLVLLCWELPEHWVCLLNLHWVRNKYDYYFLVMIVLHFKISLNFFNFPVLFYYVLFFELLISDIFFFLILSLFIDVLLINFTMHCRLTLVHMFVAWFLIRILNYSKAFWISSHFAPAPMATRRIRVIITLFWRANKWKQNYRPSPDKQWTSNEHFTSCC